MQKGELEGFGKIFPLPNRSCEFSVAGRNSKIKILADACGKAGVWCSCTGAQSAGSLVGNVSCGQGAGRSQKISPGCLCSSLMLPCKKCVGGWGGGLRNYC